MDEHRKDLLVMTWADHRRKELSPDDPSLTGISDLVMERGMSAMGSPRYKRTVALIDGMVGEGLMLWVEKGIYYALTDTGMVIAKKLFDEQLAMDGFTEEQYFGEDDLASVARATLQ